MKRVAKKKIGPKPNQSTEEKEIQTMLEEETQGNRRKPRNIRVKLKTYSRIKKMSWRAEPFAKEVGTTIRIARDSNRVKISIFEDNLDRDISKIMFNVVKEVVDMQTSVAVYFNCLVHWLDGNISTYYFRFSTRSLT